MPTGTSFPPGMLLSGWLIVSPRLCRVTCRPLSGLRHWPAGSTPPARRHAVLHNAGRYRHLAGRRPYPEWPDMMSAEDAYPVSRLLTKKHPPTKPAGTAGIASVLLPSSSPRAVNGAVAQCRRSSCGLPLVLMPHGTSCQMHTSQPAPLLTRGVSRETYGLGG